jgi:hypothetical protein
MMKVPKTCYAYYYGGLPIKGARRKGRLRIEEESLLFDFPEGKGSAKINLRIPLSKMEKIFLTRDNNYGSDTDLLNLTFRDEQEKRFTLRFAPITIVPRRRIALQKEWLEYLAQAIQERPSALSE